MALLPRKRTRNGDRGTLSLFPTDLLETFWRDTDLLAPFGRSDLSPRVDVVENENAILVTAELPGVKADEVELTVEGDTLTLRGEKKEEHEEKEKNHHRVERRYGSFSRSIHLPSSVDPEKVVARSKDGVLTIEIPKREDAKPRNIRIDVE